MYNTSFEIVYDIYKQGLYFSKNKQYNLHSLKKIEMILSNKI